MVSASDVSLPRPLATGPRRTAFVVVLATVLALVLRFFMLGERVFHWDEARIGYWILQYQTTGEWHYRAILHGPFLFHVNKFLFGVFGATDFVARSIVALVGGLLPLSAWLFRTRLTDVEIGALSVLLALNPVLVYYSRFMRSDVLVGAFAFVALGFVIRAIDSNSGRYLVAAGVAIGLAFTAKENALVYVGIFVGATVLLFDERLFSARVTGEQASTVANERIHSVGGSILSLRRAMVGAVLAFLFIIVVFYAPRPAFTSMFSNLSTIPAVLSEATFGTWSELWSTWGIHGSISRDHSYIVYLVEELQVLFSASLMLSAGAILGFFGDRYVFDNSRNLVQFAGFWALASIVLYPIITDIPGHWSVVHIVLPLAIPAAVGVRLVVDKGRSALRSNDRISVVLAVIVLLAAGGQMVAVTAQTSYVMPQDEDNILVQYGQPGSDMDAALDAIESIAPVNDGTDVLFYGCHFFVPDDAHDPCGIDEYGAENPLRPDELSSNWFNRLPLVWYLERVDSVADSTVKRSELEQSDAPIVITLADNYRKVKPVLSGYESWTYELTSSNTVIVIFVNPDAPGYQQSSPRATN